MHKGNNLSVQAHSQLMHWYRWQPYKIPFFNEAARMAMQVKFFTDPILLKAKPSTTSSTVDQFFKSKNIFFGLCTIRSGSTFLADFLTSEIPNGQFEHEPNVNDYWSYPKVLRSQQHAHKYLKEYRRKDIFHRSRKDQIHTYGELNPFLVLHIKALKTCIPEARFFHLVRDGRDVVRSIMAREVLGEKDPLLKIISPPADDPYFEQWPTMNRFQRVCWKWRYENQTLRTSISHQVHFEQMLSDYDYFKEELLDFLELEITEEKWTEYVRQPKHATPKQKLPHWSQWTSQQKLHFEKICGSEMTANGYICTW